MAFANTYLRISTANYEAIPVPQAFIDKRGPVYFPAVGEDDPIEMTPLASRKPTRLSILTCDLV
jgi:hypothetical protein